jgi:hypothetical protein
MISRLLHLPRWYRLSPSVAYAEQHECMMLFLDELSLKEVTNRVRSCPWYCL